VIAGLNTPELIIKEANMKSLINEIHAAVMENVSQTVKKIVQTTRSAWLPAAGDLPEASHF